MENNSISSEQIYSRFLQMEKKYGLLDKKIKGVYFWRLMRLSLCMEIIKKKGIWGSANAVEIKKGFTSKVLDGFRYLFNSIFNSCIKGEYTKDILVFPHKRKKEIDDEYQDFHVKDLLEKLENENSEYEIIDIPYNGKHFIQPNKKRRYDESIRFLEKIFKKSFIKPKFNEQDIIYIKKVEKELKEFTGLDFDLINKIKNKIISFKVDYNFYFKLLKKRKPKKIYIVVSNILHPLIAASENLGIEVTEIQHGTILKNHLAYHFPDYKEKVPYFPDEMILYGKYWYDNVTIPLPEDKIIYQCPTRLQKKKREYETDKKNQNQVLFLSQGTIGNKLSEIGYLFAKNFNKYEVIYKLHPEEYSHWEESYPVLKKANKLNNFTVIDNDKEELYKLLAGSKYQVGVYTTVIFEGIVMRCNTVLINLPGIEVMEYLIENKYVELAHDYTELEEKIRNISDKKVDGSYFYCYDK